MTKSLQLLSPAKLNLFLHVTGQRPDGYHTLQTVFQLLDYGDDMHFQVREDAQIKLSSNLQNVADDDNLIIQAAKVLQTMTPQAKGVDITLDKRIPLGGGLGGGSSNAATTLIALNKLWQCQLSLTDLKKIGSTLGADVPVFIHGTSAWAEGIGDVLQTIALPQRWFVVLCPRCHVSTKTVFCHKDLTRSTPAITVAAFLQTGGENDCQSLVRKLHKEVDNALIWLGKVSPTAQMTGTGACVFAAFDSAQEAQSVLANAPDNLPGFIAQAINESPFNHLNSVNVSTGA